MYMAALAALVGLAYANSFPGEFHFDDYAWFLNNPDLTEGSFRYASFLDHYGGRPLTLWTLHLNYALWGDWVPGYHAVSLLLHVLAALGLFLLLTRRWQGPEGNRPENGNPPAPGAGDRLLSKPWAWAAAALFALHPLQTQPVNYIWSRSMLLMTVFSLAALLLAGRSRWAAMAAWQMALWSRMDAIVLLPFLLLTERRARRPWLVQAGANVALFGFSLVFYSPPEVAWNHDSPWAFWMAQPAALAEYLRLMLWPSQLTIEHHFQPVLTGWLAGAALLAAATVFLVALWRRRDGRWTLPALALAWLLAWLAPSMLIPNADLINESRAYLALAGGAAALCWGLQRLSLTRPGSAMWSASALAALLIWSGWAVSERNLLWQDDVALYREAVLRSPQQMRVHYNLGSALARRGAAAEAEMHFRRALHMEPLDDLNHSALGYCAEVQGRVEEALGHYRRALQLNSNNRRAAEGLDRLLAGPEDAL
ncbi:MAG TPA: tetratricopeptide repeat protein [Acidobacteriota bacterium]|nr:tetratricopeptide repeat protein [Acidobacteriota bacterium]